MSKRVGHVVPGVVVYLSMYGSGEIKNRLIAAAWGALCKLTFDLTHRKICKIGPEKPQGECPITFNVFNVLMSIYLKKVLGAGWLKRNTVFM